MAYPEDPQRFLIDGPSGTAALRAAPPTSPESADGEAQLGALRVVVLFLLTLAACTLVYLAFAVHGKSRVNGFRLFQSAFLAPTIS